MKFFAKGLGYAGDKDFWGLCGLLHVRLDKAYQVTETEWHKLHMGVALKKVKKAA